MTTPKRLFEDPANRYSIDNNDPGAFDKRFVGTPGRHYEQQCCHNYAPYWAPFPPAVSDPHLLRGGRGMPLRISKAAGIVYQSGDFVFEGPLSGYRPDFVTTPEEWFAWQGLVQYPASRDANGLPSPGGWMPGGPQKVRQGPKGLEALWCDKCETALESAWSDTLNALPIVARGIAAIVSYIPVFGTAISFAINASVTLAEGGPIDQAILDGIGGALPGQPASGMAFNAAVSIARGNRIDRVIIDAIPDKLAQKCILAADDIIYGIATGQPFDDVTYTTVVDQLSESPAAQKAMEYAYRVAHGENVVELVLTEAEKIVLQRVKDEAQAILDAAANKGAEAIGYAREKAESRLKQYAMETGYQVALSSLSTEMRDAVSTGIVVGVYGQQLQYIGTFGSVAESNVAAHDDYEAKGKKLVYGVSEGARANLTSPNRAQYKGKFIADLINDGQVFTISVQGFDALNNVPRIEVHTDTVTPAWRRGFLVAMGLCEGFSADGPGQRAVYQTMAENGGRRGFQAGQAVQFWRTTMGGLLSTTVSEKADNAVLSAIRASLPKPTAQPVSQPVAVAPPRTTPVTIDPALYAQKTVDRARWVEYYTKLI